MPRYRFQWESLPPSVLQALCRDLRLSGSPAEVLRNTFGVRPKSDFIEVGWPSLLAAWLPDDETSRHAIVGELRNRGLGDAACDVSSAAGELSYLKSCRNSKTLRDVVLATFLQRGEPASTSPADMARAGEQLRKAQKPQPSAPATQTAAATQTPAQAEPKSLAEWLLFTLRAELDAPNLAPDSDGDIGITRGSACTFLRAIEDPEGASFVRVFSPMVSGLTPGIELLEALNTINQQVSFARTFLTGDGTAILAADLTAAPLSAKELMFILDLVSGAADHFDSLLKARFGGNTMRREETEEPLDV